MLTRQDAVPVTKNETRSGGFYAEVLIASFSGLLLEVAYTRVISFKFFYYWVYLVIGLALLGIGVGGVWVAISKRLRNEPTEKLVMEQLLLGAATVGIGYFVVAKTHVNTLTIWNYGPQSLQNLGLLLLVCFAIFISFVPIGVILSTLFGRRPERIGRLYFFDLVGAGLACAVVVSLITWIGPPAIIFLAGLLMALAALRIALRRRSRLIALGLVLIGALGVYVVKPSLLPDQVTDAAHINLATAKPIYSAWSSIFRIDVVQGRQRPALLPRWRARFGDAGLERSDASLTRFGFDSDPRAFPSTSWGRSPGPRPSSVPPAGTRCLPRCTSMHRTSTPSS